FFRKINYSGFPYEHFFYLLHLDCKFKDKNMIDQTTLFFNKEYLYINLKFFLWIWLILFAWSFTDDFWKLIKKQ
ncbi:hypothetical protein QV08_08935, partial [Gallibacterium salpingitidis]|uniref:hypothetical protein n=1 Tax=Gallibacterium salpingitidis TaxID=505341 RepID=UPI0008053540